MADEHTFHPHRRPIQSRQQPWARSIAARLARLGLSPNQISALSLVFAALAGGCAALLALVTHPGGRAALMLGAALCIQLRLLCNLFDGMVAIEGGRGTPAGAVWNDLPDRLADPLILVSAGYAITAVAWGAELGWLAGLIAMLTAYIRVLGGSLGLAQDYSGPMAKQQRMAVLSLAWLASIAELAFGGRGLALIIALLLIVVGSGVTAIRRTRRIVAALDKVRDDQP